MAALTSATCVAFFILIWIFSLAADGELCVCEGGRKEGRDEVKAKAGDDVTLQCRGPRDASITLLLWSRPDLKSDDYVFFFRNNRPNENYQLPSFHGRVELRDPEMKDGDASVIMKNVNINDTGTYKCLASADSSGEITISFIKLTVTDSASSSTAPPPAFIADPTLSVWRITLHIVVFSPYFISTVLMVSLYRQRPTGRNLPVSMTTSPPSEDDEGLDQPYDDVIADFTTEHHF